MAQSTVSRHVLSGGRLVAILAIAAFLGGCVVAASAPAADPASSSDGHPPSKPASSKEATATAVLTDDPAVVAWVDRPAAPYVEPTQPPFPADARPCRASDLEATSGEPGAGLGNTLLPVNFANVSDSACTLTGPPTIDGVRSDGTHVRLPITEGSYFGDPGPIGNIAPGGAAALNISGTNECVAPPGGSHRIFATLRIGLPHDGGTADVPARGFDTRCGVWVSAFGVPADAWPPTDVPMSPLTAVINAPAVAVAGRTLSFTVTLANPTAGDIALSPCPAYVEFVGSGSTSWVATVLNYYLNCDATPEIPAGGSVTFEMRLAVPSDQPAGMAKFGWDFQGGSGPWANAQLEVKTGG